jgi:tetratricopeptide (TPR) repeat protein
MHVASWRKLLSTLALACCLAPAARAVEPVDDFLSALRKRQMFEEALEYLGQLQNNPHVDESTRQRVLYEQGVIALESAASQRDPRNRDAQLTLAGERFAEFLRTFPQHSLAGSARIQTANMLIERARAEAAAARDADPAEPALAAARKRFDEARAQFDEAEKDFEERLAKLPRLVAPGDSQAQAGKQQLASDLAQVRMLRPTVDYELGATYPPDSADAKRHLLAAATSYHRLYETYRTRAVGLLARLWEGRCHQQIGAMVPALACFRELSDLPANDDTQVIRAKATRHALECLTSESQKKYQEAIERGERWQQEGGGPQSDPDALAIRYLTALAYQAQSENLPAKDPNRRKLAGFAREYAEPVTRHPGQYQRPAKMLLVALSGNKDASDAKKPTARGAGDGNVTFADAFEQARQALERMQAAAGELQALGGKGDEATLRQLTQQKQAAADAARQALQLALRVSDENVSADHLNSARYYLCFVEWDAGHLHEAAVLGEFLANRYADSLPGRQGARIALAAYIKMYADSPEADKQFEASRIEALGELMLKRWPGQEEADEAALQLLGFTANRAEWNKALEYLNKVSENSPRRGQAELRAGQALWSAYLRRSQLPEGERPPQAELDGLKQQAQKVLEQGVARMEKAGEVDATLAAAVFALAQICVDTGQPDKAIAWLEHPKIGPLTLVKAKHPVAARETFAVETHKLALRAYIAVQPQQLTKAEEAMDALEQWVQGGGDAKAAENLTAIYISLGRQLEQHLQDLRKSGQTKELDTVSQAFEVFLDRVTKRESGNSFASLNWVGETYFSLGGGFDEGPAKASEKSRAYFQKAAEAYRKLLEVAAQDPKFKDNPDSLLGVRLRLADCLRRAGKFDEAITIIVEVLKQKPMLLPAQLQAAETYQAQGAADPKGYALAILGGAPGRDGKNAVWGWAKLSNLTMRDPQFAETFHKARLNLTESRYRYALSQSDAARRSKVLEAAKQDLWITYKLRPDLGGQETAARYDRLLKQIQRDLGRQETGLEEFKQRDAAGATTAASP